jgi:hypothetical protein
MKPAISHLFHSRRTWIFLLLLLGIVAIYLVFFRTLTLNPATEARAMERLEQAKQTATLQPFVSDGCSANVSKNWQIVVQEISDHSESFASTYNEMQTIPFQPACIKHDRAYHNGVGGYIGRLEADNQLRSDIIAYGIANTESIRSRTNLNTDEEAIFLYELMAEAVYRSVRLGGAPCTGEPYAWGFGYNNGNCSTLNSY